MDRQVKFLETSASIYDAGDVDEAIRMAVTMRVLYHDTNSSTSLLTHLGVKRSVQLLSTANLMPSGGKAMPALTTVNILLEPPRFDFKPKLSAAERAIVVPVATWWSKEVIYGEPDTGIDIFRRDLVLWAANKDGGAHVDPELPKAYEYLESGAGWAINLFPDNAAPSTETFKNAHLAALRQMTYEVLNSPDIQQLRG